jgi:prevent-host-death family protein
METVTVAELKARLSHYLREVRAGASFTVVSRDIPVATLGPHELEDEDVDDLVVIEPTEDPGLFGHVDLPPLGREVDVVALIREDRDARDDILDAIVRDALARDDANAGDTARADGDSGDAG